MNPDVVVIGGAGEEFTHRALSRGVELMVDGIPAVAMHSGMMWATDDWLRIDTALTFQGSSRLATPHHGVSKPVAPGFETSAEIMRIRSATS